MKTIREIVDNVEHKTVRLRSIRNGQMSRAYDRLSEDIKSSWTPGFVLHGDMLIVDFDGEVQP